MKFLALTILALASIGSLDARFPRIYGYDFVITLKDSGFKPVDGSISYLTFNFGLFSGSKRFNGGTHETFAPGKQLTGRVELVDKSDAKSVEFRWEADEANAEPIFLERASFVPDFAPSSYSMHFCYNGPIKSGQPVTLTPCKTD